MNPSAAAFLPSSSLPPFSPLIFAFAAVPEGEHLARPPALSRSLVLEGEEHRPTPSFEATATRPSPERADETREHAPSRKTEAPKLMLALKALGRTLMLSLPSHACCHSAWRQRVRGSVRATVFTTRELRATAAAPLSPGSIEDVIRRVNPYSRFYRSVAE